QSERLLRRPAIQDPHGWRADRGVRGGDGTPNQGPVRRVHHRRAPIIGADLPPKIVVVVVAVAIAVVIVVASIPVEVEAPCRAPEFPWAPVVQRRRAKAGLGLGATRRQPQPSAHQHRRCKPYDSSSHDYFHAPEDALGGFVLTWRSLFGGARFVRRSCAALSSDAARACCQ